MMRMLILLYLAFQILNFCNINNKDYNSVQNSIKYDNLEYHKSIILMENDSIILTRITNISMDSKSEKILISDEEGKIIVLYDAESGEIIKPFDININFSDSLAIKGKYWNDDYRYLSSREIKELNKEKFDENYFKKYLQNNVITGNFYNDDEIFYTVHIKNFITKKGIEFNPERLHIGLATALIRFNLIDGNTTFIPLEKVYHAFAQPYRFYIDKKNEKIIMLSQNYPAYRQGNFDTLWILASYGFSGNLLELIATLPDEYTKTKLGYSMIFQPSFCINNKNELICVYPYAERVFNLTRNTYFRMKNLPHSNKTYLDSIEVRPNLVEEFLKRYFYFLPITIYNVFCGANNNIIITIVHVYQYENGNIIREWIIQEYNYGGELIRQFKFDNKDEKGYLAYIYYDQYKNQFLFFKKSQEVWIVDFYKHGE